MSAEKYGQTTVGTAVDIKCRGKSRKQYALPPKESEEYKFYSQLPVLNTLKVYRR